MKYRRNIKNITELRAEIARLKSLKSEQEVYLKDQFNLFEYKIQAPARLYKRISSFFPSFNDGVPNSNALDSDWVTKAMRIGLPYLFNKILFKKSGFIKKGLLLMMSQQVASFLNKESISDLLDKITTVVKPRKRSKFSKDDTNYGIPPDSETY